MVISDKIVLVVRNDSDTCLIRKQVLLLCSFKDVLACEDQPCLNNGTCVVYLRGYLCQCPLGYAGTTCETGKLLSRIILIGTNKM